MDIGILQTTYLHRKTTYVYPTPKSHDWVAAFRHVTVRHY